jgi:hypothetical protein
VVCRPRSKQTGVFYLAVVKGGGALSRGHYSSNAATRSKTAELTIYSLNPREEGIVDTLLEVCRDGL